MTFDFERTLILLNVSMMVETVVQILTRLVMASVMMSLTTKNVLMMVEIVVQLLTWLVMASVMMRITT